MPAYGDGLPLLAHARLGVEDEELACEMHGRYMRDVGRCGGDTGEIQGRCGGDTGEIRRVLVLKTRSSPGLGLVLGLGVGLGLGLELGLGRGELRQLNYNQVGGITSGR